MAFRLGLARFDHLVGEVLLGAGDPEDPALIEFKEMREIHVTSIKEGNLALPDSRTKLAGAARVALVRRADDGKARELTAHLQAQVAFGRGLAPAVLRPIHAGSDQLDGRRVDDVDG